ncbi:tetratricopeptide repeat protein, partial [candidate division WOR-3 bacterium]|nr:tetratricopeptide repeat protein [candidate division WOR-3 bacterium]
MKKRAINSNKFKSNMCILVFIILFGSLENSTSGRTRKLILTEINKEGAIYLRKNKYKKALPLLKEGFQLGWAYENLGDFGTAISYYKKSNPLLKGHALYRIAHCFKELAEYEKAVDYYEKLVNEFPDFVSLSWAMRELGWCYEKLGDWENAIDVWKYEFEPPFSWYKIAELIEKAGNNPPRYEESTLSLWLKIATQYPSSKYARYAIEKLPEDSLLLIGKINYFAKRYRDAASSLEGVRGGGEFLAKSLYKLGKYKYARGIARGYRLWGLAGKCSEKLNEYKKALLDYNKSFDPEALYLKARLLEKLEKPEEAMIAYRKVPENTSFFEYANFRAALLALDLGQLDIAYRCFRKTPPPISYYWCYRIMLKKGDEWKAQIYKEK